MENPQMVLETLAMIALGISLAAASGFRVFIPLFIASVASMTGHLELASSFSWLATWPAVILFGVASVAEVVAYYVPVVDNALDTISVPASAVAGTVLAASFIVADMSPLMKWALAIIAGGGTASLINVGAAAVRGTSTTMTAGVGNAGVSTAENTGSVGMGLLALVAPIAGLVVAVILVIVAVVLLVKFGSRLRSTPERRAREHW